MNSDKARNQAGSNLFVKGLLFSLSAIISGVILGAMLGFLGSWVNADVRIAAASLLGVVAVVIGVLELYDKTSVLECDKETPQSWVHHGPIIWPIENGLALGCGATSRIGFWLWYVIPLSSLLSGKVEYGALIYATYSFTRGMSIWFIIFGLTRLVKEDWTVWLLKNRTNMRLLSATHLILLGLFVIIVFGI